MVKTTTLTFILTVTFQVNLN